MKQTVRTFVAVEMNDTTRACARELIASLQAAAADVKWVEPEGMHLTLQFLGDVPLHEIPQICRAVERGAAGIAPFEMEVRRAGAFPDVKRPRTLWIGAGEGQREMVALHDAVEDALAKLGFRKEGRRFQPHLTIGRVRRGGPGLRELATLVQQRADFAAGRISVREVVVFSSDLRPGGPVYEALGRAKLAGKAET
jgi:2'-5' RNA ligase